MFAFFRLPERSADTLKLGQGFQRPLQIQTHTPPRIKKKRRKNKSPTVDGEVGEATVSTKHVAFRYEEGTRGDRFRSEGTNASPSCTTLRVPSPRDRGARRFWNHWKASTRSRATAPCRINETFPLFRGDTEQMVITYTALWWSDLTGIPPVMC